MYKLHLTESIIPAQLDSAIEDITIGDALRKVTKAYPDKIALIAINDEGEEEAVWTFNQLLLESESLAAALLTRFKPGEHITLWSPNIHQWVLIEYACAMAGIVIVTANPALQTKELKFLLEQSESVALFLVNSYRSNPMLEIAKEATKNNGKIREITNIQDKAQLFSKHDAADTICPSVLPSDIAQIQYTSGTTGFPKGVMLTHKGLANNARLYANRLGIKSNSIWINIMPMFHTSGCGMVTLGSMQSANTMLLMKTFNTSLIIQIIQKYKVTIMLCVPTMLIDIVESLEQNDQKLFSLEMISCGGSGIAPELIQKTLNLLGCKFSTLYGQTENSPVITQHHVDDSLEDICNTSGQPLPQTEVCIVNGENQVLPIGDIGEIWTRGYSVMKQYYKNPQATAKAINNDGWLCTGDLGKMDKRGYVYITGRLKDMIIRGGENHFPVEIENILISHPAIVEVAVIGLPDKKWGEIICCCLRIRENKNVSALHLKDYCRQYISPQKTPSVWYQLDKFPTTTSGKIQKFELKKGVLENRYRRIE